MTWSKLACTQNSYALLEKHQEERQTAFAFSRGSEAAFFFAFSRGSEAAFFFERYGAPTQSDRAGVRSLNLERTNCSTTLGPTPPLPGRHPFWDTPWAWYLGVRMGVDMGVEIGVGSGVEMGVERDVKNDVYRVSQNGCRTRGGGGWTLRPYSKMIIEHR